ncbi:RseA family anti-sigma factor [Enterobacter cloacae]
MNAAPSFRFWRIPLPGVDDSGILEKVLGMQKEKLSALMDGETLDSELEEENEE